MHSYDTEVNSSIDHVMMNEMILPMRGRKLDIPTNPNNTANTINLYNSSLS